MVRVLEESAWCYEDTQWGEEDATYFWRRGFWRCLFGESELWAKPRRLARRKARKRMVGEHYGHGTGSCCSYSARLFHILAQKSDNTWATVRAVAAEGGGRLRQGCVLVRWPGVFPCKRLMISSADIIQGIALSPDPGKSKLKGDFEVIEAQKLQIDRT